MAPMHIEFEGSWAEEAAFIRRERSFKVDPGESSDLPWINGRKLNVFCDKDDDGGKAWLLANGPSIQGSDDKWANLPMAEVKIPNGGTAEVTGNMGINRAIFALIKHIPDKKSA